MAKNNGWDEYKIHVLASLDELHESAARGQRDMQNLRTCLGDLRADIKAMRERGTWETRILSAFWGLIMAGVTYLLNRHH